MQDKQASVFPFFVLLFVISVPFWVLGVIYPVELLPGLPISALGAFTPAIVALLLSYRKAGASAVLQLLTRSFDFRRIKNKSWYFAIPLINPVIAVLAFIVMRVSGVAIPNPTLATFHPTIPLFIAFFIAALGEEIGWTGYATESLQNRWGTLVAGILLGLVWAVIHFIPLTQAHRSVEWIAWWSLDTIALRMIMTWLYVHSGRSLFAAAVFHAMINLSWQLFPNQGSDYDPQVFGLITLGLAIAIYVPERLLAKSRMQVA